MEDHKNRYTQGKEYSRKDLPPEPASYYRFSRFKISFSGIKVPALCLYISFLFGACVSQTPPAKNELPAAVPSSPQVTSEATIPKEKPLPDNGLNSPAFQRLPVEARSYLITLAAAFSKQDIEFLVSQGEAQYEKEIRPNLDEDVYLALLYRAGTPGDDSEWKSSVLPRLSYTQIRAIEYTEWEEKGPMLDIQGRLYLQNNEVISCRIVLAWRLPEPKILGERP